MRLKSILAALAAASMTATPAVAAGNPAAPLSVSSQTRSGSATTKDSELSTFGGGFGGILAAIIVAGVIAIVVVDATQSDDPDSP